MYQKNIELYQFILVVPRALWVKKRLRIEKIYIKKHII